MFFACTKVDNVDKRPFTYDIDGLRDVAMPSNNQGQLEIHINVLTGNPAAEPITLTIEGLPPNVTVDTPTRTFKTNYILRFTFYSNNAVEGTYPIRIVTVNNTTGIRRDTINLIVGSPVSLIKWLCVGQFDISSCSDGKYGNIDSVPAVLNRINIGLQGLMGLGLYPADMIRTYADVNTSDSTFIIPLQEVRGDSIRGKGYYYSEYIHYPNYTQHFLKMHIDDTLISGGQVINTCSVSMSHLY